MIDKGNNLIIHGKIAFKSLLTLSLFSLLISCGTGFDDRFERLTAIQEPDFLPVAGPEGPSDDTLYMKLYSEGKSINRKLLDKVLLTNKTNWYLHSGNIRLTDGDIAICLLFDINKISDSDIYTLMPDYLVKEYKDNGSRVWWNWIQKDIKNRKWIVTKISSMILIDASANQESRFSSK